MGLLLHSHRHDQVSCVPTRIGCTPRTRKCVGLRRIISLLCVLGLNEVFSNASDLSKCQLLDKTTTTTIMFSDNLNHACLLGLIFLILGLLGLLGRSSVSPRPEPVRQEPQEEDLPSWARHMWVPHGPVKDALFSKCRHAEDSFPTYEEFRVCVRTLCEVSAKNFTWTPVDGMTAEMALDLGYSCHFYHVTARGDKDSVEISPDMLDGDRDLDQLLPMAMVDLGFVVVPKDPKGFRGWRIAVKDVWIYFHENNLLHRLDLLWLFRQLCIFLFSGLAWPCT